MHEVQPEQEGREERADQKPDELPHGVVVLLADGPVLDLIVQHPIRHAGAQGSDHRRSWVERVWIHTSEPVSTEFAPRDWIRRIGSTFESKAAHMIDP
eukprot:3247097-Prymnesium_polylepis.1